MALILCCCSRRRPTLSCSSCSFTLRSDARRSSRCLASAAARPSRISLCHGCVPFCASLSLGTYSIVSIKHCSISVSRVPWARKGCADGAPPASPDVDATMRTSSSESESSMTIMSGTESFSPPLPRNVAASRQAFRSSSSES